MDDAQLVPAALGLVGAVIGASAALLGQLLTQRVRERSDQARELQRCVEDVLSRSSAIDLRAHEAYLLGANLGSIPGLVLRGLGSLAPVDLAQLLTTISSEADQLQRATSRAALLASPEVVSKVENVVMATMAVVDNHRSDGSPLRSNLGVLLLGRVSRDRERLSALRRELGLQRAALTLSVRRELGLGDPDPS